MVFLVSVFFFLFYGLPLTIVAFNHAPIAIVYALCLNLGVVTFLIGYTNCSLQKPRIFVADYSRFYTPRKAIMYILFSAYVVLKFEAIVGFLYAFWDGTALNYMLTQAKARYAGEVLNSTPDTIATLIFIISATLLGALIGSKRKIPKSIYVFLAFMIVIEGSALARASILVALLGFFAELLIRSNLDLFYGRWKKAIRSLLKPSLIGLVIFSLVAGLRVYESDNITNIIFQKFQSYILASYDLFFIWVLDFERHGYSLGAKTFTVIPKLIGIEVPQGNYMPLESNYGRGNIFLNLRGFVEDFGLGSSLIIFPIILLVVSYTSHTKKKFLTYYLCRSLLPIFLFPIYSPYFFTVFTVGYLSAPFFFSKFSRKHDYG